MNAAKWNALTPDERKRLIVTSDRSMKNPRWAALVAAMCGTYESMSALQQGAVDDILRRAGR